ncbi:MAG: Gfo/Idh/MocA family oxidoreductase [Rhizobiaceae bacterium]|nr:Gfo/Idh/MocA family oxidoreductase [Rhizobiaceae bacterium]
MVSASSSPNSKAPIRYGMVGGGKDAFIGAVHRIAARIDGHYELVAGALSSNPTKSAASARELGLERSYGTYQEMAKGEATREGGIEVVTIVTPNHMHFPIAKAFLQAGIHVICDKPLTSTLADAKKLAAIAKKSGKLFVLTHNYTGYPMVRQMREMVARGKLGDIRLVQAEYVQDWLTEKVEATGQKQAEWRTDPKRSGGGGAIGDIGTHAFNLASFISGQQLDSLAADLDSFVKGRKLDDNAHIMMRFKGGAKGMLWASQVAPGNENSLKVRVFGTKGGIEWEQENPNHFWYTPFGQPKQLITRGGAGSSAVADRVSRTPGGHPEGYLEGFATLYSEAAIAIRALRKKNGKIPKSVILPTVEDGVDGLRFIDACLRSSKKNAGWIKF